MSESNVTFNITGSARVSGSTILGVNKGNVTIYSSPDGAADDQAGSETDDPEGPDRE